jgi:predicted RNase H-like nuclease (RuvC/YqgF family)
MKKLDHLIMGCVLLSVCSFNIFATVRKKYIIINGGNLFFIEAENMQKSKLIDQNISNHFNEIIVSEYKSIHLDKLFIEKNININLLK